MARYEQYAISHAKPDICKFLIHERADVDFVEDSNVPRHDGPVKYVT